MERLQRVDEHAGDVAARRDHAQRRVVHLLQRVDVADRPRIADAGLHAIPPAVVGAGELDEVRSPGVVPRQPHRLHHRFGARHVEGHLVEAGQAAQPLDVVEDHRMVGAEHRTQRPDAGDAVLDAALVGVVAEDVDAVRAGQVEGDVAVEIADPHAVRGLDEAADAQLLADQPPELERHAIPVRELQIRDGFGRGGGGRERARGARGQLVGQAGKAGPPPLGDLEGRAIGGEEAVRPVVVERHQPRQALRQASVAVQRSVLGARQLDAIDDGGQHW